MKVYIFEIESSSICASPIVNGVDLVYHEHHEEDDVVEIPNDKYREWTDAFEKFNRAQQEMSLYLKRTE